MAGQPDTTELLRALGMNQLEAEVYAFIVPHEPLTAYAIAKAIGKPTANVYKAVESLSRRGALVIEEGAARVCRAVPVRRFMRQTEQAFLENTKKAEQQLAALQPAAFDERVYRLESPDEVFARVHQMLERCRRVAVVDGFPRALERLVPSIRKALRKGIEVHVEAYAPIEIKGAHVVIAVQGELPAEHWRSEQLNVAIDGREHVAALLSTDLTRVFQAIWSESRYLACLMHSGRLCEITLQRLARARADGASARELAAILDAHPFFVNSDVPGQRELIERYVRRPKP